MCGTVLTDVIAAGDTAGHHLDERVPRLGIRDPPQYTERRRRGEPP